MRRRSTKPFRRRNILLASAALLFLLGYLLGSILASSFCIFHNNNNNRDVFGNNPAAFEQLSWNNNPNNNTTTKIIMAGLIKSGYAIRLEPLTLLVQMACLYGAPSHIVVHDHPEALATLFDSVVRDLYPNDYSTCRNLLHIEEQAVKRGKRIEKMSHIREQQRTSLKKLLPNVVDDAVIVLMDLDLFSCPPAFKVYHYASSMLATAEESRKIRKYDVLCAGGVNNAEKEGYYDSFATVFIEGDTFNHPLHLRYNNQSLREGEQKELVLNFKNNTSVQILQWMKAKAKAAVISSPKEDDDFDPIPVQSCFGGLALYKWSAYFTPLCNYIHPNSPEMTFKYGNKHGEICEHTTFHTCLYNAAHKTVGIHLNLRTQWRSSEEHSEKKQKDGLAASKFQIAIPKQLDYPLIKKRPSLLRFGHARHKFGNDGDTG